MTNASDIDKNGEAAVSALVVGDSIARIAVDEDTIRSWAPKETDGLELGATILGVTWKRAELVVWLTSGAAALAAIVLLIQGDHRPPVGMLVLISIGVRVGFEVARRLAHRVRPDRS